MQRLRRLRSSKAMRHLVRETVLHPDDFVQPLFIDQTAQQPVPVSSMPGIFRWPLADVAAEAQRLYKLGIRAVLLFGIPLEKDDRARGAYAPDGVIQQAIPLIKQAAPELLVITDVCLCEYMDHGHCGIIEHEQVLNDPSVKLLAETAVSHAAAGADMIAPSDMMDGRIGVLREALDEAGYEMTPLLSYAVKYASAFYGPFRDAADSAPSFGDRKTYQMDPANRREALREASLDLEEGADILMVKPAGAYLDIITDIKANFAVPCAAYQVSGEFAMIKAAGAQGWIDEAAAIQESLLAIKRAGADIIISYFAQDIVSQL